MNLNNLYQDMIDAYQSLNEAQKKGADLEEIERLEDRIMELQDLLSQDYTDYDRSIGNLEDD